MWQNDPWHRRYFRRRHFHFPYYRQTYYRGTTFVSLYAFYYGICPPYINRTYAYVYPPTVAFIDYPIYDGTTFQNFDSSSNPNLLEDPNLEDEQPGLLNALDELTEAFKYEDIDALVPLVDPNTSIAVYERGEYKYSMSANDYLDLTRDTFENVQTTNFQVDSLRQQSPNVFSAYGRQEYRDDQGRLQTMYLSFALQDIGGQWTLTQVETAPARYRSLIP